MGVHLQPRADLELFYARLRNTWLSFDRNDVPRFRIGANRDLTEGSLAQKWPIGDRVLT